MNLSNTTETFLADDEGFYADVDREANTTNLTSTVLVFYTRYNWDVLRAFLEELRFKVGYFLWQRLSIVFAIIGVFGNGFIIAVLAKGNTHFCSTSLFILSLALADLFVTGYFIHGFFNANGYALGSYNIIDCKLITFLLALGNWASPLTLTLISIERVCSVVVPHKVKNMFTRKVAIFLVLAVWTISLANTLMQDYILKNVITPSGAPVCAIDREENPVIYRIYGTTSVIIKYGSWLVNVICMIIIIRSLLQNSVVRKGKSVKTPVKSVTLSLLTVNIIYFLFTTPVVMYDSYILLSVPELKSIFHFYNHFIESTILKFFSHTNNVLNFFIYFLIGTKFRQESKDFLLSFKVFRMCHHKITLTK
ncbi:somatostatin receptor type 3-like [Ruditapes philippinarum]|uniref:somatostatin receptor type 3-like n=1 Tax=Ruditapes philippinarum TaxID=129788 RepID=UPI00295B3FCE|nr:somatostatin receptor type 3-like [Ruditapes philippinarum]